MCVCTVLRRFRVASIYLDPSKAAGRLRCRYPPLKLAPGTRADLLVVLRGDEVGTLQGTVEVGAHVLRCVRCTPSLHVTPQGTRPARHRMRACGARGRAVSSAVAMQWSTRRRCVARPFLRHGHRCAVRRVRACVQLTTEAGAIVIPITAEVMSPMEFANAVVRFSKPAGLDDATDPVFRDFIVPCGKTHVSVVPLLPTSSPSR